MRRPRKLDVSSPVKPQAFRLDKEALDGCRNAAGRVAALINARRYDEATAALDVGGPYAKASMNTTIAISKLRKEIGA